MRNLFVGLLFVFLDFNLDFGLTRVGLIPDFIGYIMIMIGLNELIFLSPRFKKAHPFAIGMVVYSSVLYVADFFGVWVQFGGISGWLGLGLGLVSVAVSLYISYCIVKGVHDLEIEEGRDLNGERLFSTWKLLAIFSAISYVIIIIPVLGIISIVASLVVGIIFLVAFNKTKNAYYS